jgi:hypothetical protein
MFGTYRDTDSFAPACGFPNHNERHLGEMLLFRDVYNRGRDEADVTPRDTAPSRTG